MPGIKRKPDRAAYYARNIALDICPPLFFQRRLGDILLRAHEYDRDDIVDRVNYCNKLDRYIDLPSDSRSISQISLKKSMYYYDLKEYARYFPRKLRLMYLFGDVRIVPDQPSFMKCRPIHKENTNNVLMKLSKFRHYYIPKDSARFEDKKPLAVWRGGAHNPKRAELMRRYRGHPLCDVGFTHVKSDDSRYSSFLPPQQQMDFKYIISIEGNDVASNLKWIMASDSLCLMPEPLYETWFMEGRLKADTHYARLDPDLGNLEEKIRYYERHPDEARAIIRNANDHVRPFLDTRREQVISLLVMYKYFVATRQIEPDEAIAGLIGFPV